ncbi:MFS transporter, partial [bacterium]|nr:MFS transporter [bacterium]
VAGVSMMNVAFTTLRQQIPPEQMRGRVIAASRTLAWAGLPLGATLGGILGQRFGVAPVYFGASAGIIGLSAALLGSALWRHKAPVVIDEPSSGIGRPA